MQSKAPDLSKFQVEKRIEGIQGLKYGDILEHSFVSLIVGAPESGKSTLVEQLLLNPDLYF